MSTSKKDIEDLICQLLVKVADVPAEEIDLDLEFEGFGLDSLSKVGLITELANRLKVKIVTEAALGHNSPRLLAKFIEDSATAARKLG